MKFPSERLYLFLQSKRRKQASTYQVVTLRLEGVCAAHIQPLVIHHLEHPDVVQTVSLQSNGQATHQ